jgi:hypothetical protein
MPWREVIIIRKISTYNVYMKFTDFENATDGIK